MADFLAGAGEPEDADAVPATDGPAPTGKDGPPAEPAVALASPTSVAAGEAAGSPTDASGRGGGRGLGRGTSSGRGLGRGRSAGRGLHGHDASKRASNGFLDEADTDLEVYGNGVEEDAETKRRNRARTHACVTHLASDEQPKMSQTYGGTAPQSETKKFMRGTRKAMARMTGIHGKKS